MAPRKPTSRVVFDAEPQIPPRPEDHPRKRLLHRSQLDEASGSVRRLHLTSRIERRPPADLRYQDESFEGHKVVASTENAQGKSSSQSRSATSKRKSRATSRKSKTGSRSEEEAPAEEVRVHGLPRQANFYGLIQELVTPNVFSSAGSNLLAQPNERPSSYASLLELLQKWPDEHSLAQADVVELTELLQPLGLHNIRANDSLLCHR